MSKQYPTDYVTGTSPGPRTVWESTSTDFLTWTAPQPAFAGDVLDNANNPNGTAGPTEIYGMPAIRYGDQYVGLPWVFDIASVNKTSVGGDTGHIHIEIAASTDGTNWSRPDRDNVMTQLLSASPTPWDWGYQVTGTTLIDMTVGTAQETWLYYGGFSQPHSMPGSTSGIGVVEWPKDRLESFHSGGVGSVTTRPLSYTAGHNKLTVNYDPGVSGSLKVEVLDVNGNPLPGYGAANATAITTNATAPGVTVTWGSTTTLPTGQFRLKFDVTGGDLYAFSIG